MIEKMKTVCIVAESRSKASMIQTVRELGIVHIKEKKKALPSLVSRFDEISKTKLMLSEIAGSATCSKVMSDEDFEELHKGVMASVSSKKALLDQKNKLLSLYEKNKAWGDFSPSEVDSLNENGVELHFYQMGKKDIHFLEEKEVKYIKLSSVNKMETLAVVGSKLDSSIPATEFVLPKMGLSQIMDKVSEIDKELSDCEKVLVKASKELASYSDQLLKLKNSINFSAVEKTSEENENLVWLCGYIPVSEEENFKKAAHENNWAYSLDDISADDETVPTKVKYNRITRIIQPVFEILGTVPGYKEYDISFWFLCFFSLFFAMIIGDAGYGLIFLVLGIVLRIKQKKSTNLTLLIFVVSLSTMAWGAVTGTWFGLSKAMDIPLLRMLVIKPLANYPELFGYTAVSQQNYMMKLCFIIGTIQLSLACVMNIRTKLVSKNLSWFADLGWLISINSLYYVVLLLVIGEDINLKPFAILIGVGFVLVCMFGEMSPDKTFGQGLKAGLGNAFTNFLNTISAFGNVMSYIRLFAVGLASLAIAQSFNDMAMGFSGVLKIVGMVIFVIGHALNLVMGLLSVVVHGVRLNLLEFSGQLGMEWSGIAYEPFKVEEK